jgi:hypothetical protein
MVVLAIVVQIGVWGATKVYTDGGSLLESWRPYFGWQYGLAFAAVQTGVCWWLAIERGIVWLVRAWAITGGALLVLWVVSGQSGRLTFGACVALTAGMGALMLAAGLYSGDLVPGTRGRRDPMATPGGGQAV